MLIRPNRTRAHVMLFLLLTLPLPASANGSLVVVGRGTASYTNTLYHPSWGAGSAQFSLNAEFDPSAQRSAGTFRTVLVPESGPITSVTIDGSILAGAIISPDDPLYAGDIELAGFATVSETGGISASHVAFEVLVTPPTSGNTVGGFELAFGPPFYGYDAIETLTSGRLQALNY